MAQWNGKKLMQKNNKWNRLSIGWATFNIARANPQTHTHTLTLTWICTHWGKGDGKKIEKQEEKMAAKLYHFNRIMNMYRISCVQYFVFYLFKECSKSCTNIFPWCVIARWLKNRYCLPIFVALYVL